MPNPARFIDHLRAFNYHPRSNKHSDALSDCIVADFIGQCPVAANRAAAGKLVYDLNFSIFTGTAAWRIDLVLGSPPAGPIAVPTGAKIARMTPATVQIAIEHKAVMTEHHKAIKNRKRDFEAHHTNIRLYNPETISGGVLMLNAAPMFKSPLRAEEITTHKNASDLVRHCLSEFRSIQKRSGVQSQGLDVRAAIIVEVDNLDPAGYRYYSGRDVPGIGDPIHYDSFIQDLCSTYRTRFGRD
ncbi:MAG: hypothetical protein HY678_04905 [Chloroflexi bacterium]|nr:hypothetical protein [Chloroflexota bacterium]